MEKDKTKSSNDRLTVDNDQLGENKNSTGGKQKGCGCGTGKK